MKVLVTGANGFLGSWLCRKLIAQGLDVHILVRKNSDLSEISDLNLTKHYGDVCDLESLKQATQNCQGVFHLAGLIAYKKSEYERMFQVNVEGTKNVIEACLHNQVPKLLHLSSVVAIGASHEAKVLNENSPYQIADLKLGYFDSKHQAQILVQQAYHEKKLYTVIVNPSTIYGPGDAKKSSRKSQLKVARGQMPFYTEGGVSIIGIRECVDAIWNAWLKAKPAEPYILAGENISIKQLFEYIAEAADVSAPEIEMPKEVLMFLGKTGDFLRKLGIDKGFSVENAHTATMYHWFDSSKAQKELALKIRPAKSCISESVMWMQQQGLLDD